MFLLILDKNPYKAAELIPDRLKFKSLLELCQLICSAGISNVYKPIKQGKKLQEWVKKNKMWTFLFLTKLYFKCLNKMKTKTYIDINKIRQDLYLKNFYEDEIFEKEPQTAIFRYLKEYAEITEYESNSELPIDECVKQYALYLEWKEKEYNKKRLIRVK